MSKAVRRGAPVSRRTIIYATLAALVIGAVVAVALASRVPQSATTVDKKANLAVGQVAPQFAVSTDAGPFDLAAAKTPVFLEVFATWCPHCMHEVPVVDQLAKAYAGKVAFVGVSGSPYGMDGSSPENEADVMQWVQRLNVTYPVAFDPDLKVADTYLQGGYPTIVIIGTDKKIHYLNDGEIAPTDLANALNGVLASKS